MLFLLLGLGGQGSAQHLRGGRRGLCLLLLRRGCCRPEAQQGKGQETPHGGDGCGRRYAPCCFGRCVCLWYVGVGGAWVRMRDASDVMSQLVDDLRAAAFMGSKRGNRRHQTPAPRKTCMGKTCNQHHATPVDAPQHTTKRITIIAPPNIFGPSPLGPSLRGLAHLQQFRFPAVLNLFASPLSGHGLFPPIPPAHRMTFLSFTVQGLRGRPSSVPFPPFFISLLFSSPPRAAGSSKDA